MQTHTAQPCAPPRNACDALVMELTRFENVPGGGVQPRTFSRSLASTSDTFSVLRMIGCEPIQCWTTRKERRGGSELTERTREREARWTSTDDDDVRFLGDGCARRTLRYAADIACISGKLQGMFVD